MNQALNIWPARGVTAEPLCASGLTQTQKQAIVAASRLSSRHELTYLGGAVWCGSWEGSEKGGNRALSGRRMQVALCGHAAAADGDSRSGAAGPTAVSVRACSPSAQLHQGALQRFFCAQLRLCRSCDRRVLHRVHDELSRNDAIS